MGLSTEGRKSPERGGHSDDRKCQVTILRDYVEVLRKERNWLEAKLLNEHIHRVSVRGLQGSALEELREETQRGIRCPPRERNCSLPWNISS